jgi:hypothetical protein
MFSILHKAELELEIYDHEYFCNYFDVDKNIKCLFLSYLLFLDDFELYHNFYRSLMKVYLMLASFNFNE